MGREMQMATTVCWWRDCCALIFLTFFLSFFRPSPLQLAEQEATNKRLSQELERISILARELQADQLATQASAERASGRVRWPFRRPPRALCLHQFPVRTDSPPCVLDVRARFVFRKRRACRGSVRICRPS